MNSGKNKHAKRRARSWLPAGVIINGVRYVVAVNRAYQKYMRELRHPGGPVYQKYMQGLQSIHQNTKPKPEPNHIDGVNKRAEPEPKPLLADARVGDLCKHRNGGWSQIIDTNGTYIPGQPIRTTLKDTNGINRNFCLSGSHFTMQFGGEYDIIATEPLAEVGTAEWAWQMMLLGKMVSNIKHPDDAMFIEKDIAKYVNSNNIMTYERRFFCATPTDGWQLYEEPEPAFKVRDWVEFNPGNNPKQVEIVQIDGDKLYYNTMYAGKTIKTHIYASAITRKLDPSEVVVRIGCLSGTVAPGCSDTTIMIVPIGYNGIGDVAIIPVAMLDTPTRELVESLLKAQEEK